MRIMVDMPMSASEWREYFMNDDAPTGRRARDQMEMLAQKGEAASAKALGNIARGDPLLTLRLFKTAGEIAGGAVRASTTDGAAAMVGVERLLSRLKIGETAEERLGEDKEALLGWVRAVVKAKRAATLARSWAAEARNPRVAEISLAALLWDAPGALMWTHAPDLAKKVAKAHAAKKGLRTDSLFRAAFGVEQAELRKMVPDLFLVPEAIQRILAGDPDTDPATACAKTAASFARHCQYGWGDAWLGDDVAAAARMTGLPPSEILRRAGAPKEMTEREQVREEAAAEAAAERRRGISCARTDGATA